MSLALRNVSGNGAFACKITATGYIFTVNMEYFTELSVNRYKYFGSTRTKREVRQWMEDLSKALSDMGNYQNIYWQEYSITVRIDGFFKDKRAPDLSNLAKVTMDAIEDCTLVNDKLYSLETGVPEIGEPKLIITVKAERK